MNVKNCLILLVGLLAILLLSPTATAQEKMRLIIDTDAMAEVDDQNAIAYALFSGNHFEVEGITVNRGSDYPERTAHRPYFGRVDIDDHFTEAVNVARMCASPNIPVLKGPTGNYRKIRGNINNTTFDGSDAVNFIIERAHAPSDRPLHIYACGNLTNVALALLKDPTIAAKIEIWWLGTEWPLDYACNNHAGDLDAADALLANPQNVPFNIIPWPHKGVTFAEIIENMTGKGPQVSPAVPGLRGDGPDFTCFGDYSVYLFDRFVGSRQKEHGRSLLDVIGFAAVKNNVGEYTSHEMGAPSFVYESAIGSGPHRHPGTWVENADNPRRVTMWRHPNRDAVYNDFFNTMDNYVLAGSTSPAREASQIHYREHNLLLDATLSGNMDSLNVGLRRFDGGECEPKLLVYDFKKQSFPDITRWISHYHKRMAIKADVYEYGVAKGADLGVVAENKAAYWMAKWGAPGE